MKLVRLPDTEGLPRLPERDELLATSVAINVARSLFMAVAGHYAQHRHEAMPRELCASVRGLQAAWPRRNLAELSVVIEVFLDDLVRKHMDLFSDPAVLKAYGEAQRFVKYSLA